MKKLLTLTLVLLMAVSSALAAPAQWVNSDILGTVTADTQVNLKDDFHMAMNKDWLANAKLTPTQMQVSSFTNRADELKTQITQLLTGEPQESHEGQLAQLFYQQFADMEHRNAIGMEPVIALVQAIAQINSLEELTAWQKRTDRFDSGLVDWTLSADFKDSEHYVAQVAGATLMLSDADEYKSITASGQRKKDALTTLLMALLARCGYEQADAEALIEKAFAIETEIASGSLGSSDSKKEDFLTRIYNPVPMEELRALSPVFPIDEVLLGMPENTQRVNLTDVDWLQKINELYTMEHLEELKALLICTTLCNSVDLLDQKCVDLSDAANSAMYGLDYHTDILENAYTVTSSLLSMAVGKMYVDNYVDEHTREDVKGIIEKAIDVYRVRLSGEEWLSESTRQKAIEKLDTLTIRVVAPEDWSLYNYDTLTFKTYEEGGSLLSNLMALRDYNRQKTAKKLEDGVINHDEWDSSMAPQTVNAFYSPLDNSINILAGILGDAFYDPSQSDAYNMGRIGTVIGHEISHAFDPTGSQFDAQGNMNDWWTAEDHTAFSERTQAVKDYYASMEVLPGQFVDGQLTIGETVADLGGMTCMLEIAKNMPDFDYETFFTSYADVWKSARPAEVEELLLKDVHAPAYLRTNVTLQQQAEFYTTFDIQPEDGMYVAPEKRLSVW